MADTGECTECASSSWSMGVVECVFGTREVLFTSGNVIEDHQLALLKALVKRAPDFESRRITCEDHTAQVGSAD